MKFRKLSYPLTISIVLAACVMLFSGCRSETRNDLKTVPVAGTNNNLPDANALTVGERRELDDVLEYFVAQDYQLIQTMTSQPPTDWESRNFNMKSKAGFAVKRKHQVKDLDENTYFRFSFIFETYENEQEAKIRVARLYERPPAIPNTEPDKAFPLRKGFSAGKNVYVLTTDVYGFTPELDRLTEGLQKKIESEKRF